MRPAQINSRSEPARRRIDELVRRTGMTATTIVELALLNYVPAAPLGDLPRGFVRKGRIVVGTGGHRVTATEVQASIDAVREGERD